MFIILISHILFYFLCMVLVYSQTCEQRPPLWLENSGRLTEVHDKSKVLGCWLLNYIGCCWQVVSVWWWLLICVWQFIYLLKQGVYSVTSDLDPFLSRENILLRHRVLGKSQAWSDVQPWPSWCRRKPKPDLQSCREQKHLAGVLLGSIIIN